MNTVAANKSENNPIYRRLIDYDLISKVFQQIEALEDSCLRASRLEIKSSYERITTRYLRAEVTSPTVEEPRPISEWRELSQEQLIAFSQQVFEDVCQFVLCAMTCYRIVDSSRPLSDEEKKVGDGLRELLNSLQQLIPISTHDYKLEERVGSDH